jgi:glycosyltransferase involved in cell wall biosynthesis
MKVGVFSDGNLPSLYAHTMSLMKMAQGFASLGHDTQVITTASLMVYLRKFKIPGLFAHYGVNPDLPFSRMMPSLKGFLTNRTGGDPAYTRRAVAWARGQGFGLVYCRSYLMPYQMVLAGVPTAVETHTTEYDKPELRQLISVADQPAFKALVTIHEDIKAHHVAMGVPAEKIVVAEDGVDLERFRIEDDPAHWKRVLGLDPGQSYAVYCGHLYEDKGIEVILQAAELLRERQGLKFLLVGGFEHDRRHWEKRAKDRGLTNLRFTGFVPGDRVPGYLKAASCLLLPYKPEMNFKVMDIGTTSPLKLFEYLAARRAIVATDIPTVAKVLRHESNGLLVPPGQAPAFARAIKRALDEPGLAARLGQGAYDQAQRHTWAGRCQAIVDLLRP